MTGRQIEALRNALCDAFDQDSLDQMLRLRLDKRRQQIVSSGDLSTVVFKLIEVATREGWETDLIRAAQEHNPGNPTLRAFCDENPELLSRTAKDVQKPVQKPEEQASSEVPSSDGSIGGLTPWLVLQNAIKAVPALK